MENNTHEQILNLIDKSQNILLLTHAKADCDGLGSMISMYLALQDLGKTIVAATNDPAPDSLSFLPSINIVQNSVASNDFIISLDIQKTPLNKIKYKLADDKSTIKIIVTPKAGRFKQEDVSLDQQETQFDLIITFDTGNLEHLGSIYDDHTELFFNTPLINIDHHASNTDYGQVNHVDVVAASTTEVMIELLESMERHYKKQFINEDVATLLLAGLITDTGSFQHANTSPRAMEVAAKLLDMGARQQEIIKNIYKTKKLSTLKLWGTVLSKVETDPVYRLVWSSISQHDLSESKASSEESEGIIDDLLSNAPGAEVIMLFKYNDEGYVSVSMRSTTNSVDVGQICSQMGGGGHVRAAGFKRRDGSSLETLIEDTLSTVRQYQGERLNIHPEAVKKIVDKQSIMVKPEEAAPKSDARDSEGDENEQKAPQTVQYLDFRGQASSTDKSEEKAPNQEGEKVSEAKKSAPKKKQSDSDRSVKSKKVDVNPSKKEQKTNNKIQKGEVSASKKPQDGQKEKPVSVKVQTKPDKKASSNPKNEGKSVQQLQKDFVSKKVDDQVKPPVKPATQETPKAEEGENKNLNQNAQMPDWLKPKNEAPQSNDSSNPTPSQATGAPAGQTPSTPNQNQAHAQGAPAPSPAVSSTPPRRTVTIPTTPPPQPANPAPSQTQALNSAAPPVETDSQIAAPPTPAPPATGSVEPQTAPIQPTPQASPTPPPLPPTMNQPSDQNNQAGQEIPPAPLV